jgi:hypothetical protein
MAGRGQGLENAEKLITMPTGYHFAVVVQYNMARIPRKGSAIFLHCGSGKGTAGCIAVSQNNMKTPLGWFMKDCHPVIMIGNSAEELCQYNLIPLDFLKRINKYCNKSHARLQFA